MLKGYAPTVIDSFGLPLRMSRSVCCAASILGGDYFASAWQEKKTCCSSSHLCLCSIAVTVTALHPTRLCRIAVFSVKPTFSHKHPDGGVLALISQCDFALSYLWVYPLGLGSCFFPFLIYAKYDLAYPDFPVRPPLAPLRHKPRTPYHFLLEREDPIVSTITSGARIVSTRIRKFIFSLVHLSILIHLISHHPSRFNC